jgi:hypothetical protein
LEVVRVREGGIDENLQGIDEVATARD